jgi:hypothetical protein
MTKKAARKGARKRARMQAEVAKLTAHHVDPGAAPEAPYWTSAAERARVLAIWDSERARRG